EPASEGGERIARSMAWGKSPGRRLHPPAKRKRRAPERPPSSVVFEARGSLEAVVQLNADDARLNRVAGEVVVADALVQVDPLAAVEQVLHVPGYLQVLVVHADPGVHDVGLVAVDVVRGEGRGRGVGGRARARDAHVLAGVAVVRAGID